MKHKSVIAKSAKTMASPFFCDACGEYTFISQLAKLSKKQDCRNAQGSLAADHPCP